MPAKNKWSMIEIDIQRDPWDEEQHTAEAMRSRADHLKKVWRHIWDKYKEPQKPDDPPPAAHFSLECSGTGHVHAHIIWYGAYLPREEVIAHVQEIWPKFCAGKDNGQEGGLDIRAFKDEPDKPFMKSIAEGFKYVAKTPSLDSIEWHSGTNHKHGVIHPVIAGRWEFAIQNYRTHEKYGWFRKITMDDRVVDFAVEIMQHLDADVKAAVDASDNECCPDCGGNWVVFTTPLELYVKMCINKGIKPFNGVRELTAIMNNRRRDVEQTDIKRERVLKNEQREYRKKERAEGRGGLLGTKRNPRKVKWGETRRNIRAVIR